MSQLVGQILVGALVSTALGVVTRALTPKPKAPKPLASDAAPTTNDILGTTPDPGGPQIGIFGNRRVGGRTILYEKRDGITYVVIAIAGAPVHAVNAVYINGYLASIDQATGNVLDPPWRGLNSSQVAQYSMNIALYDGSQTEADAVLEAAFPNWTEDYIGTGCAYARIRIDPTLTASPTFAEVYKKGLPDFTFDVSGFTCYDPRDGDHDIEDPETWTFSKNAAIINANYLIHPLGHALPTSRVDWTSVEAAADICDQSVDLAGGGAELRYESAAVWYADERHESVLERLGAAHAGGTFFVGDKYRMRSGAWEAASASFSSDDYEADGISFSETPPIEQLVNGVRGTFTSPGHGFETRDFPSYQDATALAGDGAPYWLDLDLQGVTSPSQAQRLARIAYNKARYGFGARVSLNFGAFDVVANDVIAITDALAAFDDKTFRVVRDELSEDFTCELELEHELESFYAWDEDTDEVDFEVFDPVRGAGGPALPPGAALWDFAGGSSTVAPIIRLWGWANDNVEYAVVKARYSSAPNHGNLDFTFKLSDFAPDYDIAAFSEASGNTGNMTEMKVKLVLAEDAGESEFIELLSGTTALTAINNSTHTSTTRYRLPPPQPPKVLRAGGGGAVLRIKQVAGPKSDAIEIWANTVNDFDTASLSSTESNADANISVTGDVGDAKFYWARTKYNTGPVFSIPSNPSLVVF